MLTNCKFRSICLTKILLLLLLLYQNNNFVQAQNWLIDKLLPDDYNPDEVPVQSNFNNGIIQVNSTIKMNDFRAVQTKQNLVVDLQLCVRWHDYRIRNRIIVNRGSENNTELHYTYLKLSRMERIWIPKLIFRNAIDSRVIHSLRSINFVDIWPEQQLLQHCSRRSVTFVCHYNFSNFPFDEQFCHMDLESIDNINRHLIDVKMVHIDAVGNNNQFRVRNTYLIGCEPRSMDIFQFEQTVSNNGGCSTASLRLVRRLSYYIIRYYCPCFLLVCISFVEFWIPTNAWPARVIFTCVVEITLIHISMSGYDESPSQHMTSLYWYLWGCQFFIYMNLVEFALALAWVQFIEDKQHAHATGTESPDGRYFGKDGAFKRAGEYIEKFLDKVFGPLPHWDNPVGRNKVDYFARVVYLSFWGLYIVIYVVATIPVWGKKYRWSDY